MSRPLNSVSHDARTSPEKSVVRQRLLQRFNVPGLPWHTDESKTTAITTKRIEYVRAAGVGQFGNYGAITGPTANVLITPSPDLNLSCVTLNTLNNPYISQEPAKPTFATYVDWALIPLVYISGTNTAPPDSASTFWLERRLSRELERLAEEGPPEGNETEDPLAECVEASSDQHGPAAILAVTSLLESGRLDSSTRERILRALGFVRNGLAVRHATALLVKALADPDVQTRDAAVWAMGLGADPEHSAQALREFAAVERVTVLRSAMLQTAEQLEAWGHRRAALAKDRAEKVAG